MKPFTVNIVTPEKTAYSAQAVSVTLPGTEGYLGVWADHAPLVSGLRPGVITIKLNDAGQTKLMASGGGFVEISHNTVNVMTDSCEEAGEIDRGAGEGGVEEGQGTADVGGSGDRQGEGAGGAAREPRRGSRWLRG